LGVLGEGTSLLSCNFSRMRIAGKFGKVYKAKRLSDGKLVALKAVKVHQHLLTFEYDIVSDL